jgi:hypothetical protein
MTYTLIQPPNVMPFVDMDRTEAMEYFEWFTHEIPNRLSILEQAVQSDLEHGEWVADKSPNSLLVLGSWFASQVSTQKASQGFTEFAKENQKLQNPSIPVTEIDSIPSDRTLSLIIDISMYFGEVFTENFEKLYWGICDEEEYIDYNQPVIQGLRSIDNRKEIYCPTRRLIHVVALGYINRSLSFSRLFQLYEIWSSNAPRNTAEP